jgi:hypothetical protein
MVSHVALVALVASSVTLPALAGPISNHDAYLASVSTYQPMQEFNHVVNDKRFVGYFLADKGGCSVTVITTLVDDIELKVAPQRAHIDIPAAGRAEIPAGNGDALGIACTADGDQIKVVALKQHEKTAS